MSYRNQLSRLIQQWEDLEVYTPEAVNLWIKKHF